MEDPGYPPVPTTSEEVEPLGENLPTSAVVYFIWRDGVIVYVGQTVNLRARFSSPYGTHHEKYEPGDTVGYVEIPTHSLDWAECYYIGICRPKLNFGKNARWRREAA